MYPYDRQKGPEVVGIDEVINYCESFNGPLDPDRSLVIIEHLDIPNLDELTLNANDKSQEEFEYPTGEVERILTEDIRNRQCYVHLVKILSRRPQRVLSSC